MRAGSIPTPSPCRGQSCGGIEAIHASADPRVTSTVLWNSGLFGSDKTALQDLHAPIAYVDGGRFDIAYANGVDDFGRLDEVPAFIAHYGNVGHGLNFAPENIADTLTVAIAWLNLVHYGDREAGALLLGPACGLCNTPPWHDVESKNWPR